MKSHYYRADSGRYHLEVGKISDAEYDRLKPIIEHLNGHWREKTKCFVFPYDVKDTLSQAIQNGVSVTEKYRYQEETQFYPTPAFVAERVAELADIPSGCTVLEPSAGTGSLLDAIHVPCNFTVIEPLEENTAILKKKGYDCIQTTFEEYAQNPGHFERVIMNSPFAQQNDIKHTMLAYQLLNPGGVLVSIISENALYYNTETSKTFLKFLDKNNAYVEAIPSGAFTSSGTTIETVIVRIKKAA